MRRFTAVFVALVALVLLIAWLSRRSERGAQLVAESPAAVATASAATALAPIEKDAEAARRLVEAHPMTPEPAPPKPKLSGPRSRIFGRVVDARGVPVAEARVDVYCSQGSWSRSERLAADTSGDRKRERCTTTTDVAGTFSFDAPLPTAREVSIDVTPPPLLRRVQLQCGGFLSNRPPITLGDNDLGDIPVGAACAVSGLVVDESGKPIAGASFSANMDRGEYSTAPARSDADGVFVIGNLIAGERKLSVSAPGRRGIVDMPFTTTLGEMKQLDTIVLGRASILAGVVVDEADRPVEKAYVRARSARSNSNAGALSDERGAFRITLSVDDAHTLSVAGSEKWAGLADPNAAGIEYPPGREDVRLVVKPAKRTTFRVHSAADGFPIERFGLEFRRIVPSGSSGATSDATIEDHPGGVVALAVDPLRNTLVVDAPGFASVESAIVLDAGSTDTQTIAMSPEGVIVGRVFVGDAPAPGARLVLARESWNEKDGAVTAWPLSNQSNVRTDLGPHLGRERLEVTGANAGLQIGMLATGTYALTIRAPDGTLAFVREIGVVAGRTTDVGEIHVPIGGTLRGRFFAPPDESPLGFMVATSAIDRDHSFVSAMDMRRVTITRQDGRFEIGELTPGTYAVQWIRPERTDGFSFSGGDKTELPRVLVKAGQVSELVLDASNTSRCVVLVHVLRRGEPFAGATVRAWTKVRDQPDNWETVNIGVTDAQGRVEGRLEGGLRFRLQVYESERGPLLAASPEDLESVSSGRIEREMRLETGTLVLVLLPGVEPPEKGEITVSLASPNGTPRSIDVVTPGWRPSTQRLAWKGSVVALGPVAAGSYSVRVSMRRYDIDPTKPNTIMPSEMRPVFTTDIEVRADAETRIEVR